MLNGQTQMINMCSYRVDQTEITWAVRL